MAEVRITKKKVEAVKLQLERKWMEARIAGASSSINQSFEDVYVSLLALVVGSSDFDELVKK